MAPNIFSYLKHNRVVQLKKKKKKSAVLLYFTLLKHKTHLHNIYQKSASILDITTIITIAIA